MKPMVVRAALLLAGKLSLILAGSILQAATGTIADVAHVVILMQENRSFDHYFGSLRGVRGFADPRVLELANGDPVWRQPVGTERTKYWKSRGIGDDVAWVYPFHLNT